MSSIQHTGTVTFLFTDIEGSTQLWERYPEAMKAALARHDALLRRVIDAHQGYLVKMTGDGCHAAFATAAQAAAAALEAQRALNSETWDAIQPDSLRVRMGLHTGEAEARAGDYFGSAPNRAARLMSIGHGGQILLSAVTADLVREGLRQNVTLLDLGEHRLKDLVRPERVFQLLDPGLRNDFPPLKSLDAFSNNLPVQLTSFVGREKEIADARRLLGTTHLLTLTGSGGTGKSRLSLQVAGEILPDVADGAWLVELAPLTDPALITPTIASVFGLHEQPGQTPLDLVTDYLRAKQLLLILDNCEHLIAACAQLADRLLHTCPRLKIIASSREALGVSGETIYHVPSLSLPEAQHANLAALSRFEAVQLFVERASTAQPGFTLTEQNAAAVAQICRRLDGIPLAIELAAARCRVFTPEQIAARLDDRFRLLTGGSRTALPRQQTLRALIDWSYDLLPEAERTLLWQLSVFAGGWTFEAAEAVCADPDLIDPLAHLVDKSLVSVETQGDQARYNLLETVRQYAREKLFESGDAVRIRDRHLDYFLNYFELSQRGLRGPDMLTWMDWLDVENDNCRAAFEWALENDPVAALRLATYANGPNPLSLSEAHSALTMALAKADAMPVGEGEAGRAILSVKARALACLSFVVFAMGNNLTASAIAGEAIQLARQIDDTYALVWALGQKGLAASFLGDAETARAAGEEATTLCRAHNYLFELGMARSIAMNLALFVTRDWDQARRVMDELIQIVREVGNPWMMAMTLSGRARLAARTGDLPQARAWFLESAELFHKIRNRHFTNVCLSELGHALRQQGEFSEALTLYRKSILVWQELGRRAAVAHELECFAFIAGAQGQPQRAAKLLGAAEALRAACEASMTQEEREEYEQAVSQLRAQTSQADFASAWAEGRALAMEDAIAYALEGNPPEQPLT
jgi:predicted ATPase/class 3 adenylate cyclase